MHAASTPIRLLTCLAFLVALRAGETRDPWLWPFAGDSIWNVPIGADADYQGEGHFKAEGTIGADIEFHYRIAAGSPKRKLFEPDGWPVVDGKHGKLFRDFQIDDDIVVRTHISNNVAAFLLADGTVEQLGPFVRMEPGGQVVGIPFPFHNGIPLTGPGAIGTHWGSGLSALGGALRHGELTGDEPIRHALKLDVQGKRYLRHDPASPTPGWRWPATTADNYAGKKGEGGYEGGDPRFVQGSLLAIHPRHTAATLALKTKPARKLFAALRDYGAYIVDDAASDSYWLCPSWEAAGEFREAYGHPMEADQHSTGPAKEWYDDVLKLMTVLSVIDDNRADNVGGRGARRVPHAPPIGTIGSVPPSVPGPVTVTAVTPTSVSLSWIESRDDVRVAGYHVLAEGAALPLAETFGRASVEVTGLKPATAHVFRVRAYDTGLNRSQPSAPVSATTAAIAPGTILEDFDSGRAEDWTLVGATVRTRRLELGRWDGDARAFCTATTLSPGFTFSARIETFGGAPANSGRVVLRHHDDRNRVMLQFGGGLAPIVLSEVCDGRQRILGQTDGWTNGRVEVSCDAANRLTVALATGGSRRELFVGVATSVAQGGQLGFEASFNSIHIDDVRVMPVAASR